jgi:outer membrane protein assembly factor BamB
MKDAREYSCAGLLFRLEDVDALASDDVPSGRHIRLSDDEDTARQPTCGVRVTAYRHGEERWRLSLDTTGSPTGINAHSAACPVSRFALVLGSYCICLEAATGELVWKTECDWASCFGVYFLPGVPAIIVHGETEITRLSPDGERIWQSGGRDIFTGPFTIAPDGVHATDFNSDVYLIALDTGESRIIEMGAR